MEIVYYHWFWHRDPITQTQYNSLPFLKRIFYVKRLQKRNLSADDFVRELGRIRPSSGSVPRGNSGSLPQSNRGIREIWMPLSNVPDPIRVFPRETESGLLSSHQEPDISSLVVGDQHWIPAVGAKFPTKEVRPLLNVFQSEPGVYELKKDTGISVLPDLSITSPVISDVIVTEVIAETIIDTIFDEPSSPLLIEVETDYSGQGGTFGGSGAEGSYAPEPDRVYETPSYESPAPTYETPTYESPVYEAPSYDPPAVYESPSTDTTSSWYD